MTPLYVFALVAGAPLLLWFVVSGGDDGGAGGGDGMLPALSLTTLAFVATAFGASGLALTLIGVSAVLCLIAAVVIGVSIGVMNNAFFFMGSPKFGIKRYIQQ